MNAEREAVGVQALAVSLARTRSVRAGSRSVIVSRRTAEAWTPTLKQPSDMANYPVRQAPAPPIDGASLTQGYL
jgi:hypothetical protein